MNERRQSDKPVVPKKRPNKGRDASRSAEDVKGRGLAKGNSIRRSRTRAQIRNVLNQKMDRVRQVAVERKDEKFTTLWHHVYSVDRLREAYFSLKRKGAAGVDGVTWEAYGKNLENNLVDLSDRLKRGAYRAPPVRRVYIPKADGRQRPLGVPAIEDRVVQRAASEVIGTVYEEEFLGFSYGFRPGRSQHNALDALCVGIERKKVNWVLDADIRGFFDAIDHEWLMKFISHRIADKRVHRFIKKWLHAGVMEDGVRRPTKVGTPQGGGISPLLANVYLHYAFDLWAHQWRRRHARDDIIIVRYADDFVVGFKYKNEAERFLRELRERLNTFKLELHPDKTRLIEFGRFAAVNRAERGEGKPPTFKFLGFTHICATTRKGRFKVVRRTRADRLVATLRAIRDALRKRLHWKPVRVAKWLASVMRGWLNYHAIPDNGTALQLFRRRLLRIWRNHLRRRSQRSRCSWCRMYALEKRYFPSLRIRHKRPYMNLRVIT